MLTIKQLTQAVGQGITPRMVRHYHQIDLLPPPERSTSNYRLYSEADIQRLQRIVALKQQGFQLTHIKHMLSDPAASQGPEALLPQFQQQYQTVLQQLIKLRQTAMALRVCWGAIAAVSLRRRRRSPNSGC